MTAANADSVRAADTLRSLRDLLDGGLVPATRVFDPFYWAETLDGIAEQIDGSAAS